MALVLSQRHPPRLTDAWSGDRRNFRVNRRLCGAESCRLSASCVIALFVGLRHLASAASRRSSSAVAAAVPNSPVQIFPPGTQALQPVQRAVRVQWILLKETTAGFRLREEIGYDLREQADAEPGGLAIGELFQ